MESQNLQVQDRVNGFIVDQIVPIDELNSTVYFFTHEKTGARAIHLFNDDRNNLFSIAFRTPVSDNTGVPHILEHSVLAGSKKYPLKDPFKELLKSSMQTFLNAITYPDRTLYPVASQVETDYFNLVDVYCDAVFNPLLTEHTFSQEGWHYDVENTNEPVSIKGIVYNEMKGVFSDFQSHVARKMLSGLFPDTTYFFESGGEPEHITDLTYDEFKDFHDKYYHPSNSFIVLYGDVPSEKTLGYVQDNFLKDFDRREVDSEVQAQPQWDEPRTMTITAPSAKEDDGTATVLVNWKWDGTTDGETGLICEILSRYLFNGESAPLKRALLDSGLGEDLDDMCGYDHDLIDATFSAGLHKSSEEDADKVLETVMDVLQKEVETGFDAQLLEGAIRRLEFKLREIRKGGHFPYPLRLAEGMYRSWIYGGDPLTHIAFEKPLASLKEKHAQNPRFFEERLKELTLDNPHRLTMVINASSELGEKLGKQTEEQSKELSKDFSDEQIAEHHKVTTDLLAEQKREHTEEELSCIPQLGKEDIPLKNEVTPIEITEISGRPCYLSPLFTAGITYFDIGFDLSVLPQDLVYYYPLYAEYLTRAGAGGITSPEMAKRVNLHTGGISCSDFMAEEFNNPDNLVTYTNFHGKSLASSTEEMLQIVRDILIEPDFTDKKLLKNILFESRNDLQSSLSRAGHSHAVLYASARLSPAKAMEERMDGVAQYRFLKELSKEEEYDTVFEAFKKIHSTVISKDRSIISLTTPDARDYFELITKILDELPVTEATKQVSELEPAIDGPAGIEISSSVNYVARSWKTDSLDSEAVGELYLMGRILSTGFLWDKVRVEGGAYGGMAMVSSSHPLFSFASYRDPNLKDTVENYEKSLIYIRDNLTQQEVDKAICGAVGKLDIPKSPHTKGFGEVMARLVGNTVSDRQKMRKTIISCSAEALKKRAVALLNDIDKSIVTVFASEASFKQAIEEGYDVDHQSL